MGVFFQWIQMYENNDEIMAAIARNVVWRIRARFALHHQHDRCGHPGVTQASERALWRREWPSRGHGALYRMGLEDPDLLAAPGGLPNRPSQGPGRHQHARQRGVPWIGHAAGRAKFLRQTASLKPGPWGEMNRHMGFSQRPPRRLPAG